MFGCAAGPVMAQESFFKGKTIQLIVPAGPGGAFGLFGQILSKFLPKQIPGNPSVVPQFMEGAGGIRASNYIANKAPNDGTTIYLMHEGAVTYQRLFPDQVMYDARKFIPIGIVSSLNSALAVRKDAPAIDMAGFKQKEVVLGSTGHGSYQFVVPMLLNKFQNTKFKMIEGYPGTNNMILALDRGEIQGMLASLLALKTSRPDWVNGKGVARIVFQMGDRADPAISSVPLLTNLAVSNEERDLYSFMSLETSFGRSLVAPAGVPENRTQVLRAALAAVLNDKEFTTLCAERGIPLISGTAQDLKAIIDKAFATPRNVVETARKYMTEQ
jgi:tripartite-type tricarboxylate transporter receptor subunit TctC